CTRGQRWRAICRTGQAARGEPVLFHAARPSQLSRPGHHRSHPRRPSATRSDRRQAAGAFASAAGLGRAALRAWVYLSRTELKGWSHRYPDLTWYTSATTITNRLAGTAVLE